jgi:antitoxin (DNA-binding transcriptional repressor) of toxin-antitoxin stability system
MRAVGLKALKNKLSEYVRLAAGGETVLVLDRERVVAELVPPSPSRPVRIEDALLAEGVRRGYLTPPRAARGGPPRRYPQASLREILKDLDESRADRDLPR